MPIKKTKQEVINFLESLVGTTVVCKGTPSLNGQCVTLIKALMEFIGVPDPYKARGHAKTVISAYLSEGIADEGTGFLSVFSNKNMGGGYGHIWCNAGDGDGTYYESNGAKPLIVTKGKTYSYDSVCNFDKYIKGEDMANTLLEYLGAKTDLEAKVRLQQHLGENDFKCNWGATGMNGGYLGSERAKNGTLTATVATLQTKNDQLETDSTAQKAKIAQLEADLADCELSEPGEDLSKWVKNGLVTEVTSGNTKTITNYKPKI